MITTRLRTALLGSGAVIALVAATAPGMANEMDEMRAQIQALQAKINTIETTQSTTRNRRVMPAAGTPVVSGVHKGYIIPGTKTSMRIGGYVKADFVYDFNAAPLAAKSLAFKNLIPGGQGIGGAANALGFVSGSKANQQNTFKFQSRQTRFNIRTWTPTDWGELATHIEVDFFGKAGTETITNSHSPRMRHAYGRLGPVLAGQTWTTFMDLWAIPETVDFFAVASESFIRQTMLRYTHNLGGGTTLMAAIENPQTNFTRGGSRVGLAASPLGFTSTAAAFVTGVTNANAGSSTDVDHIPDFVLALVHVWKGVGRTPNRVKLSGVIRQLTVDSGGGQLFKGVTLSGTISGGPFVPLASGGVLPLFFAVPGNGSGAADSTIGWGTHIGVRYWVTRNDQLQFAFNIGEGLGRYMLGTALQGGAVLNGDNAANAKLNSILSYGGHAVWKHHWTDTIRTNFNVSWLQSEIANATTGGKAVVTAGTQHVLYSTHANLIWSPVKAVNIGLEYQWAKRQAYNISNGTLSRVQVGFQYKF